LALFRIGERELESGSRDAEGLRADDRPRQLERLQSDRRALVGPLTRTGKLRLELLDSAEHVLGRHRHVLQQHLGGVRGADAHLLLLLALSETLRARRYDEACLSSPAYLGLD